MGGTAIPLIVLGGSDRRPGTLPPAARGQHPLSGYKGIDIRLGGKPLIEVVVERFRAAGTFDPIYVAGPRRVFEAAVPGVEIIDTDASVASNIRTALDQVRSRRTAAPERRIALTVCDILPDPGDLERLLADFEERGPKDVWFPIVRAPEDPRQLKASGWKPFYELIPEPGEPAVRILPGHLMILDPTALRLGLLYRLVDMAYETRNRPLASRHKSMATGIVLRLVYRDFLNLMRLRPPSLTWRVLSSAWRFTRKLHARTCLLRDLEEGIAGIVVKRRQRRRFPERGVRIPILEGLSLAADIDTIEEAQAIDAAWSAGDLHGEPSA